LEIRDWRLDAPANLQSLISDLQLPTKLEVDGKDAGDLTSVALSPRLGPLALAYVRSAHAEPGSVVGVAGTNITAEVIELPFAGA
jgi:glycine cleavage system aminomethyltransferase T